jgi:hypothetical protein
LRPSRHQAGQGSPPRRPVGLCSAVRGVGWGMICAGGATSSARPGVGAGVTVGRWRPGLASQRPLRSSKAGPGRGNGSPRPPDLADGRATAWCGLRRLADGCATVAAAAGLGGWVPQRLGVGCGAWRMCAQRLLQPLGLADRCGNGLVWAAALGGWVRNGCGSRRTWRMGAATAWCGPRRLADGCRNGCSSARRFPGRCGNGCGDRHHPCPEDRCQWRSSRQ